MFTSKKLNHITIVIAVIALVLGTFINAQAAPLPQPLTISSYAQSLTFSPVADSYVRQASPASNYGTNIKLWVEAGTNANYETNLSFTVSGAPGPAQSAKLRLYATSGTVDGPAIYATNNNWTQTGVTWNTRPARTSARLDDKGAIASNTWIEFNVTPLLSGNGTYSFVLVSTSTDSASFSSREGSQPPQLVLSFGSGVTATTTKITSTTPTNVPTGTPFPRTATTMPTVSSTSIASKTPISLTSTPTALSTSTPSIAPIGPLHAAFNTQGGIAELSALGFNLFDIAGSKTNPAGTLAIINGLPEGAQALVWLGNLGNAPKGQSCPTPGFSDAEFQAVVDTLANNPKVFGYDLADEPHPSVCSDAANAIKARSDYIHTHAPGQKTYITVLDGSNMCPAGEGCEYYALRPETTHVDLIGIDPYPCHFDSAGQPVACDISKISQRVQSAIANGIPVSAIVPVFQAFGQEGRLDGKSIYYRTPTTTEFQDMLNLWKSLIPNPVFDFAYTWGIQCTVSTCPAPQSLKNHPELQLLIEQHNSAP